MKMLFAFVCLATILISCEARNKNTAMYAADDDSVCLKTAEFLKNALIQMKSERDSLQDELNRLTTVKR